MIRGGGWQRAQKRLSRLTHTQNRMLRQKSIWGRDLDMDCCEDPTPPAPLKRIHVKANENGKQPSTHAHTHARKKGKGAQNQRKYKKLKKKNTACRGTKTARALGSRQPSKPPHNCSHLPPPTQKKPQGNNKNRGGEMLGVTEPTPTDGREGGEGLRGSRA